MPLPCQWPGAVYAAGKVVEHPVKGKLFFDSRYDGKLCREQTTPDGWLKQCRQQGMPTPAIQNTGEDRSLEAKLEACCRQKGLYQEQVQRWKEACLQMLAGKRVGEKQLRNSNAMFAKPSRS